MRKLLVFNMMSLVGFFADAQGGLDWHVADAEFGAFANEQAESKSVDTLLFRSGNVLLTYHFK